MKIRSARFTVSAFDQQDFPIDHRPEVAVLGRSNVGKSSLINCLTGRRELARTSSTPGRTRCINFYLINDEFYLADLPGYGYAAGPAVERQSWKKLAENYLTGRASLTCCLVVVDLRRQPTTLDQQMADWLNRRKLPYVVIATKSDKLSNNKRQTALAALGNRFAPLPIVVFSARSGFGREEILRVLQIGLQGTGPGLGTQAEARPSGRALERPLSVVKVTASPKVREG